MKKKLAYIGATAVGIISPLLAFAQGTVASCASGAAIGGGTLEGVLCEIDRLFQIAIPILILGAVAWFIWGIVKFMTSTDAEEKGAARGTMIHGIIGFAVIIGLWGIVTILLHTFSISGGGANTSAFPTF